MASENVSPDDLADPIFDGLDPLKARLVQLLMQGATIPEAAADIGRSERRLRVWRKEPAVKAALKQLMGEAMGRARVVLTSGALHAATALVEMADGSASPDMARVAACKAVLDTAARLSEVEDLADRIDDLETRILTPGEPQDGQDKPQ